MELFTLADRTARSFALTLRLLPALVREEICLAYLLARASDSVADAAAEPAAARLEMLRLLASGAAGEDLANLSAEWAGRLPAHGEAELLGALPAMRARLDDLDAGARDRIREVLDTIISGQALDVERFGGDARPGLVPCLPDEAALVDYTWRVAGCVGEFWTSVLAARLPGSLAKPVGEMRRLGRSYGQGLQLLNILRDAPADWDNRRCYLPLDASARATLAKGEDLTPLFRAMRAWIPQCREWLDAGSAYGQALRGWRVCAASRLPATLGHLTLQALEAAGQARWRERIKIPRSTVRRATVTTVFEAFFRRGRAPKP